MADRKRSNDSPAMISRDLVQRLQAVTLKLEDLAEPIPLLLDVRRPFTQPRFYVQLHRGDRPVPWKGWVARSLSLSLPVGAIQEDARNLALSIWHLGDRLRQFARISKQPSDAAGSRNPAVLICADLANRFKHHRFENVSRRNPEVGQVEFNTGLSGDVDLGIDELGRLRLWASESLPIPYKVQINLDDARIDDAFTVFYAAIQAWLSVAAGIGALPANDRHMDDVRMRLQLLASTRSTAIIELPPLNSETIKAWVDNPTAQ